MKPTLDELRHAFANQMCWCPGACVVDGVQGPCPLGSDSLPDFIRDEIRREVIASEVFARPLDTERLVALCIAVTQAMAPGAEP